MTTWYAAADAVRTRFYTLVSSPLGLLTLHDNQSDIDPPTTAPWVRFSINGARVEQVERCEVGARTFKEEWSATAAIFSPLATGDRDLLVIADQITAHFKAETVGEITYRSPSLSQRRRSGDGWHMTVTIPFYIEDLG